MANEVEFPSGIKLNNQTAGMGGNEILSVTDDGTVVTTTTTVSDLSASFDMFNSRYDIYDSTGGQSFTDGTITLNVDTERISSGDFSNSTGEITCEFAETNQLYYVSFRVSTDISTGTARSTSYAWLELDDGGGFTEVAGFRGFMYNRDEDNAANSTEVSGFIYLNNGDKLRIRVARLGGSDTIITLANGSKISLFTIQGARGERGPSGAPGDITWEGSYNSLNEYTTNQAVEYNGNSYVATQLVNTGEDPESTPAKWDLLAQKGDTGASGNLSWEGSWAPGSYNENEVVENNGSSWVCTVSSTSTEPVSSGGAWDLVASAADALVKEAGYFAGATGNTLKARGISCNRTATGRYTISFDTAKSDNLYVISGQVIEPSSTEDDVKIHVIAGSQTTSQFQVVIYEGDNGGTPDTEVDRDFYVMVASW
jgi:hypothetical protein